MKLFKQFCDDISQGWYSLSPAQRRNRYMLSVILLLFFIGSIAHLGLWFSLILISFVLFIIFIALNVS
jgi:hypothetical protein